MTKITTVSFPDSPEALQTLKDFDKHCIDKNKSRSEMLWNYISKTVAEAQGKELVEP